MNRKLVIAIVLEVVATLLVLLCPSVELMTWFSIIGAIFCIIALVLNQIVKKENSEKKWIITMSNIFGILVLIFCLMELISVLLINNPDYNEPICQREDMVSDCVDQGDGLSSCKYMKQIDIPCNSDILEDSQIK